MLNNYGNKILHFEAPDQKNMMMMMHKSSRKERLRKHGI